MIEYPSFLPCPEWVYGEGITSFVDRTPMESGWVRQRAKWPQSYTAIDLTFTMSTQQFSRWQDWVNANGYDWFEIALDRFSGEKKLQQIRFTTPVQYSYDDFNSVVISVSSEVYGEKENPAPIPPLSPGNYPECRPYSCSSYVDWLNQAGINMATAGLTMTQSGEPSVVPWPFSVDEGLDGKDIMYTNFTAGAADLTSWPDVSPNTNRIAADRFTETVTDAVFCTGTLNAMGSINHSAPTGTFSVVKAGARTGDAQSAWGDHYVSCLVMGQDIGRAGDNISGLFLLNSGKQWRWTRNGTTYFEGDPESIYISASTSGTDVTISLFIGQRNGQPDIINSFVALGAASQLELFQGAVNSGEPYEVQAPDGLWYMARQVTLSASYAGQSASITGTQYYVRGWETQKPPSSIQPWYNSTWPSRLYDYGQCLYNMTCNIGSYSGAIISTVQDYSILELEQRLAWEQNKPAYLPPDYCGGV